MKPLKILKIFFKILGVIILLALAFLIVASLLATFTDYRPPDSEIIKPKGKITTTSIQKDTLDLMSWNIGYGGLGAKMDFFYDGGNQVRPSRSYYNETFECIEKVLQNNDTMDFILLQEVDKKARRSYRNDQEEQIIALMPQYQSVFAKNYDVLFVPVPLNDPMGKVVAGLMSLSQYVPATAERVSFPGNYAWPKSIFMLDRCFITEHFVTDNGSVLMLINTHNSAFDDGTLRKQQFDLLRKTALDAYAKGYYVIIGGDWNQNPPGFDPSLIQNGDLSERHDLPNVPADFMPPEWSWAFDPTIPSNRDAGVVYRKGKTSTTILDYFLLSPNIQLLDVSTLDLGFNCSDHNPVTLRVKLKNH
jgi:endonuclease/exonuclease/phosphatase family metal-dependent hydrolase